MHKQLAGRQKKKKARTSYQVQTNIPVSSVTVCSKVTQAAIPLPQRPHWECKKLLPHTFIRILLPQASLCLNYKYFVQLYKG